MPRQNKTGKKRIRNREQLAKALQLRKAGATLEQIGKELGGLTRSRAHQIINDGLEELNETCHSEAGVLRRLEAERLDSMLLSLWPNRASPRVADTILRLSERRAKLYGLDAPTKVASTTPDGDLPEPPKDIQIILVKPKSDGN